MCIFSCVADTDKEKLCLGDNVDLGGGGSDMGPSAALTPAIWDKTIPYDGENFHLEYMELEEFLMENGIPADEDSQRSSIDGDAIMNLKATPSAQIKGTKPATVSPVALLPIQELDRCEEEVVIITNSESEITCDVTAGEWQWEGHRQDGYIVPLNSPAECIFQGRKPAVQVQWDYSWSHDINYIKPTVQTYMPIRPKIQISANFFLLQLYVFMGSVTDVTQTWYAVTLEWPQNVTGSWNKPWGGMLNGMEIETSVRTSTHPTYILEY